MVIAYEDLLREVGDKIHKVRYFRIIDLIMIDIYIAEDNNEN